MPLRPPYTIYNLIDHLNVPQLLRFNAFARNHVDIATDEILILWITHDLDGPRLHDELVKMHTNQRVYVAEEYDADDEDCLKGESGSSNDNKHDDNDDALLPRVKEPADPRIVRAAAAVGERA